MIGGIAGRQAKANATKAATAIAPKLMAAPSKLLPIPASESQV